MTTATDTKRRALGKGSKACYRAYTLPPLLPWLHRYPCRPLLWRSSSASRWKFRWI